jgi:hypothetical protein
MARYGYGYSVGRTFGSNGSVDGFIAGIKKGLEQAIEPTANEMLEEIVDIINQDIYSYNPHTDLYKRTGEILHSVSYDIIGTHIIFKFGNVHTIDTVYHHYLNQGCSVLGMIEGIAKDRWHDNKIMDDLEAGVINRKHFMRIYQKHCRERGIKLE